VSSIETQKLQPALHRIGIVIYQWLASLKLAVVLMVVLAAVLAAATFVEAAYGREYAQWYVYHSSWFIALLGILALNIMAATWIRYPWGRARLGFLLAHLGLLLLLAGSIHTFTSGIDGSITFAEGETARRFLVPNQSRFTVAQQGNPGAHGNMASVFVFRPGPVAWPEGKTLDLGYINGTSLKIIRYYPPAQVDEHWQADESQEGKPALEFAVLGPDGQAGNQAWLAADPFGGQMELGPAQLAFYQAGADTLVDDFLNPPAADSDPDGVLSMHYEGQMKRIPVRENVGKKIALGDSGLAVEIVEYLPDAQPNQSGKFTSASKEPINPLLELRVYVPGKETPLRQIAFAKQPVLSLDIIHGWSCPVKFWYHHPAVAVPTGVEFLQTPDGKLYSRVGMNGKYESRGEVRKGDQIAVAGHFQLKMLQHLPSARREVAFSPADDIDPEQASQMEAAALVEVDVEGANEKIWLRRNDQELGTRQINTPDGPFTISFDYEHVPLEFSLKLLRFEHGLNPGRMGDASFGSTVRLTDRAARIDRECEISMNQPLVHGKYVFYQASYDDLPDGTKVSSLSVGYDPGRTLKHVGCILLCIGTFVMFYMRSSWSKILLRFGRGKSGNNNGWRKE